MAKKTVIVGMGASEVGAYYEGAKASASFAGNADDGTRMIQQALELLLDKSKYRLNDDGKDELTGILVQILSKSSL